ncbi:M1 family metallopeptidase [Chryseolinea sp. T2]|uniref:M1 family metallopeptidase n=1 Tax=Chryseolinea sp. T2 TaxID=3129255 RepID=UPI003077D72E
MRIYVLLLLTLSSLSLIGQPVDRGETYQPTTEKKISLIHTKLEASFDYAKSQMAGNVAITLRPYFYPTDSVQLDAKGMDIHRVSMNNQDLRYRYDGLILSIKLGRIYKADEQATIDIKYTAKPSTFQAKGSAAINDARGMYFINPTGKEKNKPTQIWTQGETQATSVWCPTIDHPNQKCTSEMILRVPSKYVSLSNGKLIGQQNNADGTRTDHWKMELPHSPYLFFIGIGDYAIIKDKYKQMEVNYYVEKEYAPVARKIFGYTPEMIGLFERLTGVDYPWVKYSQMTARDYVSGAMENTTATLHGSSAQQDARQLVDENSWERVISHELFHQWFGDYVTAESWSNLSMNESFATYAEYLWDEYKHGAEYAHSSLVTDHETYLNDSSSYEKDLVRFHYNEREDMFDNVSYQKGGAILHLLRVYVGDSAFFKGLKNYLVKNKFGNGEAHQLRLALEEVSGQDLNWFFDQWFFNHGHPMVDITYDYSVKNRVTVNIVQTQPYVFRIPLKIDVHEGTKRTTYNVLIDEAREQFTFPYSQMPDLVNVDADKFMLWQKADRKTLDNYLFQYQSGNFVDRLEAVHAALYTSENPKSQNLLKAALKDKSERIRVEALRYLPQLPAPVKETLTPSVVEAVNDKRPLVQAEAIDFLASLEQPKYADTFRKHLNDSSYSVAGNALSGLMTLYPKEATAVALNLKSASVKGNLAAVVASTLMETNSPEHFEFIINYFNDLEWYESAGMAQSLAEYVAQLKDEKLVMRGVDLLAKTKEQIPEAYKAMFEPTVSFAIKHVADKKREAGKKKLAADIEKRVTGI